eukprot:scaffold17498_cov76-Phaeocystis_antarctica.AAC.3
MSARSHDDHSEHGVCGRHGGGLRAGVRTDCRHWCNPGRTLLSWVDAMLWMNLSPPSQARLSHTRRNYNSPRNRVNSGN